MSICEKISWEKLFRYLITPLSVPNCRCVRADFTAKRKIRWDKRSKLMVFTGWHNIRSVMNGVADKPWWRNKHRWNLSWVLFKAMTVCGRCGVTFKVCRAFAVSKSFENFEDFGGLSNEGVTYQNWLPTYRKWCFLLLLFNLILTLEKPWNFLVNINNNTIQCKKRLLLEQAPSRNIFKPTVLFTF